MTSIFYLRFYPHPRLHIVGGEFKYSHDALNYKYLHFMMIYVRVRTLYDAYALPLVAVPLPAKA